MAIFGLGGIGLAAIIGAKMAKASRIIAIDINPAKFDVARELGATDFVNPQDFAKADSGGYRRDDRWRRGYSFECVGNVQLMRAALECHTRAGGESVIIGVAGAGQEISAAVPAGHRARLARFGVRRRARPHRTAGLCGKAQKGEIPLDTFITRNMPLEMINKAFDLMHEGKSIRTVIHF